MRISDWSSDVCSSDLCTEALALIARVEAAEIRIGTPMVNESVVDGDEVVGDADRVQPEHTERQKARCRLPVETPDGSIGEHARFPPLRPAGAVEAQERVEDGVEGRRIGPFDARSEEHTSKLQSLMRTS